MCLIWYKLYFALVSLKEACTSILNRNFKVLEYNKNEKIYACLARIKKIVYGESGAYFREFYYVNFIYLSFLRRGLDII